MSAQINLALPEYTFDLTGGRLCLDFVNTMDGRAAHAVSEKLKDYSYLLAWGIQAGVITEQEGQRLLEEARRNPTRAEDVLEQARTFREALYRLLTAHVHDEQPTAADLAIFNATFATTQAHARITVHDGHFQRGWDEHALPLDRMLWDVAHSAADLLTSDDLHGVKTCGRPSCDWVFLDTSKNRSRRWCDMKTCGNRVKARRHYERQKQEGH